MSTFWIYFMFVCCTNRSHSDTDWIGRSPNQVFLHVVFWQPCLVSKRECQFQSCRIPKTPIRYPMILPGIWLARAWWLFKSHCRVLAVSGSLLLISLTEKSYCWAPVIYWLINLLVDWFENWYENLYNIMTIIQFFTFWNTKW